MRALFMAAAAAVVATFVFAFPVQAAKSVRSPQKPNEARLLTDEARLTLDNFQKAPEMGWFRTALKSAKGILVVPNLVKAGFIVGGSGGKGVYFTKDVNDTLCKGPSFYNLGSVTFGLQAGGEASQVIILAMNDVAAKSMLSPQFKLGADASVAAGPVGAGAAGQGTLPTAAFLVFNRSKGLFGGLTIEGAVVTIDGGYNAKYYGKSIDPAEILVSGQSSNAGGLCTVAERPSTKTMPHRSR